MFFKKIFLVQALLCIIASEASAQFRDSTIVKEKNKFYFQMGIGYNFNSGAGTFTQQEQHSDSSDTYTRLPFSYGKGVDISMGFGKMVSKNFGFELELGGMIGSKNTLENQYYVAKTSVPYTDKQELTYRASTFRVNPKIVFELPVQKENVFFYGKIGYMIGVGNAKITSDEKVVANNGQKGSGSYEWSKTGGVVYGSTTALGFRFASDKYTSVFIEFTANNLSRKFAKQSMTEAVDNGKNTLDKRSVYSKETVYLDELTTKPAGSSYNQAKPQEELAYKSNYSTVGFRVGFIQYF